MKTIKIKVGKKRPKETQEERLDRIKQSGNHLVTKVVPNKKKYNRQRFKNEEV